MRELGLGVFGCAVAFQRRGLQVSFGHDSFQLLNKVSRATDSCFDSSVDETPAFAVWMKSDHRLRKGVVGGTFFDFEIAGRRGGTAYRVTAHTASTALH